MNENPSLTLGTWRSVREHEGGGPGAALAHDVTVELRREGRRLIVESYSTGFRAELEIRRDENRDVAVGMWREDPAPDRHPGVTYMENSLLIIARDGRSMKGGWMGGDPAAPEVYQGEWTLTQGGIRGKGCRWTAGTAATASLSRYKPWNLALGRLLSP
jgi:hypothetical protein